MSFYFHMAWVDRVLSYCNGFAEGWEECERRINSGELSPGERLPSKPDLAKEFEVSRPTLREALKMLQREGTLISKMGSALTDSLTKKPLRKRSCLTSSIDKERCCS
ncbi:winged helix-turn-helix domain-containing protein [Cohnella cellulosilytica]|uniref:Winged helix-turn-helix domain-containing protein n=1 Tax=Cohnella cellulosilytica TaxID=986710 RepID=A0ABW2FG93_9BACL